MQGFVICFITHALNAAFREEQRKKERAALEEVELAERTRRQQQQQREADELDEREVRLDGCSRFNWLLTFFLIIGSGKATQDRGGMC